MRATEILEERVREAYLYHSTYIDSGARIVATNKIEARTGHPVHMINLPKHKNGYGNIEGVSLTRSLEFAKVWTKGIVLVLDQQKLRANHLIRPFIYYRTPEKIHQNRREAEEFVVGEKGIDPLDRYLVRILIRRETLEFIQTMNNDYGDDPEESLYYHLVHHPLLTVF